MFTKYYISVVGILFFGLSTTLTTINKQDSAVEYSSRSACFDAANKLATIEGKVLGMSYVEEFEYFATMYDICVAVNVCGYEVVPYGWQDTGECH